MRWERNPLYVERPKRAWPRWAFVLWIVAMAAVTGWLIVDGQYLGGAIYGVIAATSSVYAATHGWIK